VFAGFRFVRANPLFLSAITLDLFAVLFGGAVALLPIYAKDILQVGPAGLGYLRAAPGIGALSMALVTTRLKPWQRPGLILLFVVAGFGLATIGSACPDRFRCRYSACSDRRLRHHVVIRLTLGRPSPQITCADGCPRSTRVHRFLERFGARGGATAALFGPTISVVGGGVATVMVVLMVRAIWPQLARIRELHTLAPAEEDRMIGA
jgi:hypothetical protein